VPNSPGPVNQIYEVQIAGLPLKLRSTHDEKTVQQLIALVDKKVREAMALNKGNMSFQSSLLLAALHIAEDLLNYRNATDLELQKLESRALQILTEIEPASNA
jgi:cell division protein ZapA